jgi:hypothetical protein
MKKFALILAICIISFSCARKHDPVILLSENATILEQLAAKEVRRYVYLRTGELLTISEMALAGSPTITFDIDQNQEEQEFTLKTTNNSLSISGGSPRALLYGAYEFAEQLGIRFYLHGDVIPDEKIEFEFPELDISKKPVFDKRGIQPFHDFPEGPDWWNEQDYKSIVAQLAKMKMNFIGFHTYPERSDFDGQAYKAEPLVWIGKEEDIGENGSVRAGYPVLHFHTYDSTWGYLPMKTSEFSLGLSQIFETDNYGADYMKHVSAWPHTDDENNVLFQEVGNMFGNVFGYAKALGFTTCLGTETPVLIPQKMKDRYGIVDENDTEVKEIYKGIFSRITETYPLDYYWLWTPENWTWHTVTDEAVAKTERDIQLAREVLEEMDNPFSLATCGWVLGPPKDRTQFDRVLNKDIAFSCINRALGYMPVDPGFDQVVGRSKWAIPWMEDDPDMITAQLWVGRLRKDALDAYRYGCDGLFGIHWRTRILGPNVSALARAAWECDDWLDVDVDSRDLGTEDFYTDWVRTQFGLDDRELVALFVELDSKGTWDEAKGAKLDAPLNTTNWVDGPGALWVEGASKERLNRYSFIPMLESYSDQVHGAGNKERFKYWINSFKFNRATVATALAIKQLDSLMKVANGMENTNSAFAENEILSKRMDVARQWAEMVKLMLAKFTTNGELGNLANLEMHSKKRLGYLNQHDAAIEKLLGKPLPAEARLSMEYPGEDRVLVFTNPSMLQQQDEFHARIRVLSNASKIQGTMLWRKLGEQQYQEIPLTHMARNVFEIQMPVAEFEGDFEYYFEVKADEKSLVYPATAREINCSVVVM